MIFHVRKEALLLHLFIQWHECVFLFFKIIIPATFVTGIMSNCSAPLKTPNQALSAQSM